MHVECLLAIIHPKFLSFGMTYAPATHAATFQGMMYNILQKHLLGKLVLVYLDDILVLTKIQEEYLEHLCKIFNILCDNKLYAKLSMCLFCRE